jgi:hypothetical protein
LSGGTIALTIDQLLVTDDLTITGLGASNLTVSGNNSFRVFDLQNGKDIVIDGLTISGGRTIQPGGAPGISSGGAGIRSTGTLLLSNSVVTTNRTSGAISDGGGIFQFGGSLTITDSTIAGNSTSGNDSFGGGISTNGGANVVITGSTINGNSTASGGESTGLGGGLVVISGNLTLTASSVSNNTNTGAGSIGGGVVVSSGNLTITGGTISGNSTRAGGGGILFGGASNTATVTNTTITGNTATGGDGGGISVFQGTFNLRHSTVTGNTATGGLGSGLSSYSDGSAVSNTVVTSSIIAGNAGSDVDNVLVGLGGNTISSSGFNVVGSGNATASFGQASDQTGVSSPGLAPLADNGGPTLTHALLAGSPAFGAGDTASTEATDQRGAGFARVVGGNVDLGAFEVQATDPSVTLSRDNANISEAGGVATFTATLSEISGDDVTVTLGLTGTATGGGTDYTASGTQIVIAAGTLGGSITVTAVDDTDTEGDETVIVDITAVSGGIEDGTQQATTTILDKLDFGDAPTATQSGFAASYPVTLAQDGARHTPTGPTLGAARDAEADGAASTAADGDDLAGADDEDGAMFAGLGILNTTAAVNIVMGNVTPAKVDAWIDFNRDGDWDDAGEKILDSVDVSNAMQTLNYTVPAGITAGDTYARVRLSTAGGLSPTGLAADGEVEDHLITIGPPQVESVVVNGGDPQRSGITSVQVTFDRVVDIDFVTGDVFEFVNTANSNVAVDIPVVSVVGGKTVVDMTFAPGLTVNPGGGLNDGDYVLTIDADRVNSEGDPLDGNGNGSPGDDYVFGASALDNFYRKYGDFIPDGTVDLFDFAAFRSAFGKSAGQAGYEEGLDAQNDGIVDLFDFAQFRANFGT